MGKPGTLKDATEFATNLEWDDLAEAIMGIERLMIIEKHSNKERNRLLTLLSIYEVEKAHRLSSCRNPLKSRYMTELLDTNVDINIEPDDI